MVKVSVIMTAYNCTKYIDRAISSVLNQSLKDIELIVVDDGSTDQTAMILDDWAKKDNRIKVIHKKNSGCGHSINVGIDNAGGEYIANLDSDDFMEETMLEAYYNVAKTMGAEVVRGDFIKTFELDGKKEDIYCRCTEFPSIYYKMLNPQKLEEASFRCSHMIWTGLYKRDFLNAYHIRGNEAYGATYSDNSFSFQVLCNCTRLVFVDQVGVHYQADTPNSSTKACNSYAMEREYGFIYGYLKSEERYHKFIPVYWYYYYLNCIFIAFGIHETLLTHYIKHIRELFLSSNTRGELQRFCFSDYEWNMIMELLDSPEEFAKKILCARNKKELVD